MPLTKPTKPSIAWLVDHAPELQALPTVAHQALLAIQDPRPDLQKVAQLIGTDQALAAEVLRLANSAFAQRGNRTARVSDAVMRLGTEWLWQILVNISTKRLLETGLAPYGLTREAVWRHAATTALAASMLAADTEAAAPEVASVAGLLHDVGKILLANNLPEETSAATAAALQNGTCVFMTETEMLGFDHAAVGGAYLAHLQLPDAVCDAVARHHAPYLGAVLADVVHVADLLAHRVLDETDVSQPEPEAGALDRLQLNDFALASFEAELRERVLEGFDPAHRFTPREPVPPVEAPAGHSARLTPLQRRRLGAAPGPATPLATVSSLASLRAQAASELARQDVPLAAADASDATKPLWRRFLGPKR